MSKNAIATVEEITKRIIAAGAVEVRDVDNGEEPFVYSTGNRGPGYVMMKGLVGQPEVLKFLTRNLAQRVVKEAKFDFIEGNATGGMVPAWQLRNDVSEILGREIPYCYLRGSRKEGGHGELITGDRNNPLIKKGMSVLIVEELVNYAGTTTNAAEEFRAAGYPVTHGACLLSYDHPESNKRLKDKGVTLVALLTLPQLLDAAGSIGALSAKAVSSYKEFLASPLEWQLKRNLVIPDSAMSEAETKGYKVRKLEKEEALKLGAPESKINSGVVYCARAA